MQIKELADAGHPTGLFHFEPRMSLTALAAKAFLAVGGKSAECSLIACIFDIRLSSSATSSSPSSSFLVSIVEVSRSGRLRPGPISPMMSPKLASGKSVSSLLDRLSMRKEGESSESCGMSVLPVLESHSLASRASRMRRRPSVSASFVSWPYEHSTFCN